MIDIVYGSTGERDLTISSEQVSAVVFPCYDFEELIIYREMVERFGEENLSQPRLSKSTVVDWVNLLGEVKEVRVVLRCWRVKEAWVCFVGPLGDMFSYNMAEDWLKGHFSCTYDKGRRRAFFNPMNFHNCIIALEEAINCHDRPPPRSKIADV
jgi:hypothetical protein